MATLRTQMPVFDFSTQDFERLPENPFASIAATKDYAISTLVMNSDNYAIFAACLAETLKDQQMLDVADLYFFTNGLSDACNSLLANFGNVVKIPLIKAPVDAKKWPRFQHNYQWLPACYTKLYTFLLVKYEKSLFLDADMLCRHNFAQIFALEAPFGFLAVKDKRGVPTGPIVDTQDLENALIHGYGISGAFFCVKPSEQEFLSLLKDLNSENHRICDPRINSMPFNAGPDEILLSMQITGWREVSREFCCVPWLAHRFERGEYKLEGENEYDGSLTNRVVYLTHYASEKPWQTFGKVQSGEMEKLWEDVRVFYDVMLRIEKLEANVKWLSAPTEQQYFTREECDKVYDSDYRRKFEQK